MKTLMLTSNITLTDVARKLPLPVQDLAEALRVIARNTSNAKTAIAVETSGFERDRVGHWLVSPTKDALVYAPRDTSVAAYSIAYTHWKLTLNGSPILKFAYLVECSPVARKLLGEGHTIEMTGMPAGQHRIDPTSNTQILEEVNYE